MCHLLSNKFIFVVLWEATCLYTVIIKFGQSSTNWTNDILCMVWVFTYWHNLSAWAILLCVWLHVVLNRGVQVAGHARVQIGAGPDMPIPWKIAKLLGSLAILVHNTWKTQIYQASIQSSFKYRFAGGPMKALFSGIWILSPLINLNKVVRGWPRLTKLSGSTHSWPTLVETR